MPAGYYDETFEPWVRGIRGIGSMIAQQPMLRAAAQDRAQRAQLTQAQIGTEGAQAENYRAGAGKANAETQLLIQKGQLVTALERSSAQAQQDIAAGNIDTPAVREFSAAASALTGVNGDDIIAGARQGIGTLLGRQGKVTEAASTENPVEIEKARIGAASREKVASGRGTILQPGAALIDAATGRPIYTNPSAAAQREGEYEETSVEYPAVDATEGTPAKPAGRTWYGRATPAEPGTPGTPYQPKRVVKTRRKIGDAMNAPAANQAQDPDDPSEPVEEPTGQEDDASMTAAPARTGLNFPKPATFGKKGGAMTKEIALQYLEKFKGDRAKAEAAAKADGYQW